MLSPMMVRCEQCGGENNPQYHFCGMCGTPLPRVASSSASLGQPPPPTSLPSFRSLGDQPRRDVHYLLQDDDDDEPRSRGGLLLATVLLLLIALGGGAAWYWHNGSWPWESRPATASVGAASSTPPPAENTPAAPIPPEAPARGLVVPPVTDKQETTAPPTAENPAPNSPDNAPTGDKAGSDAAAAAANPPPSAATTEAPTAEPPPVEPPPPSAKKVVSPRAPAVKTAKAKPADALVNAEDRLVSEGEKYLYGNGVPQNCERSQRDLLTAAKQENARAYTLLGAMYATGHCVTRDLPTAYRWFARALHQDPGNARLQQNLEVIWRQMTPEERQAATHGG